MPERIPQSTTIRVPLQAYSSSDHVSPATGKTIAITISKNGAAYGNPSGGATNATEIASGSYYVDLSTTDTGTTGPLFVLGTASGTDNVVAIYNVVKATNAGFTALPDTAVTTNASLLTSGTGTDQLSVTSGRIDIGKALGTAVTLDANNVLNVSAKYWAGTAITATSIPVATAAGASGGLFIAGTNDHCTITNNLVVSGTTTLTGAVAANGGVTFTNSAGDGFTCSSTGSNGNGITISGNGSGDGIKSTGGATGNAWELVGGGTSGDALKATTTSGHGFNITATGTAKDAFHLTGAAGSSGNAAGHGINAVGGAATTSSGGTAGVGIKGLGGAGAASTNGAGEGMTVTGGGTTTVSGANGLSANGSGNLNGAAFVHAGSGQDLLGVFVAANFGAASLNGKGDWNTTTPPTVAAIATGVWTDTTAADFTTAHSIGKCLFIDNIAPGASNGLAVVGSNMGSVTSVSGAVGSVTGNVGGNVNGSVGSVASGGITRSSFAADTGLVTIRSNTAAAGGATSITLDGSASATDSFYVNDIVLLTGGTGAGQARFITVYVGSTKVATVTAWTTNPDNTTTFAILPFDAIPGATAPTAAQNATAVWTDLLASSDFSTSSSIGKLLKDNIDAAISSRMATYTQPTGFLAATFPSGTIANTTNITAGTITTVTTVTNQLTAAQIATGIWQDTVAGDFTAANSIGKSIMNGVSLGTGLTVNDITTKTGYNLSSTQTFNNTGTWTGNITGSVGSVTGAVGSVTGNVGGNVSGSVGSVVGLTASDVGAIKAKTDSLTFTVSGKIDSNILYVNGVQVKGSGTGPDPWQPV